LAFAVITKAEKAVETLLDLGADPIAGVEKTDDPDYADWNDRAPLYLAARLHFENIFKWLYQKAAQLHGPSPPEIFVEMARALPQSSPLERRIIHGKSHVKASHHMAKRLSKLGIATGRWSPLMSQEEYYLPLYEAVGRMDLEVCKALLQDFYGTSARARDELFYFCMTRACAGLLTLEESMQLIDFALKQGCNVDTVVVRTDHQWRAVNFLIEQHQIALLLWLLKFKPNVGRLKDTYSSSPLWQVIDGGLSQAFNIELLLQAGADPNLQENTKSLETPLHLAVRKNLLEDVRKLCAAGADPDISDASHMSPFRIAVAAGNLAVLRELITRIPAVRINANYGRGQTALSQAAALGHSEIIALLLENGATIGASRPTAFHVAAREAKFGSLKVLLAASKDFDLRDDTLSTPLQLAIEGSKKNIKGAFNCVTALLEAGANPNTHNSASVWAVHALFRYFQGSERYKLVQLFHAKGAQLDVRDTSETSLLHLAAFMGDRPLVKFLLNAGLSPSLLGNQKQTPLHDCVRSVDQKNGAKPEHIAALCEIMTILVRAGANIPYQPYLALRGNDSDDVNSVKDDNPGLVPEVSISLVGKTIAGKVQSSIHKMQEKLQAKKRLEQEERAMKVEGTGLLVFRDFKNVTALEMAVGKKNCVDIAVHLLKLHAETLLRLRTTDHNDTTESDIHWHEVVLEAVASKILFAKNWAVFRHFVTNDLLIPASALSWKTAVGLLSHALKTSDLYLISMFLKRELVEGEFPRFRYPRSRAPFNWPNIQLPAGFCAFLNRLHNIAYGDGIESTNLGDVFTELEVRAKVYEATRFHSITDMLHGSWKLIRCMDLQTASYFFGNEYLSDLIYIVGKSWADTAFAFPELPIEFAPGQTSTPLVLVYNVSMDPKFSHSRVVNLERVIGAYTSLMDNVLKFQGTIQPLNELEVHVAWLKLALNTEMAKKGPGVKRYNLIDI
jgi:ankyrin repeat protein